MEEQIVKLLVFKNHSPSHPYLIMSRFATWTEYYSDNNRWSDLDLRSFDIIQLMNALTEPCVQNLKDNNCLVVLTIDPVSKEPILPRLVEPCRCPKNMWWL